MDILSEGSEMYSTAFCPGVRIERQYATHDRTCTQDTTRL
jgi:hypothetical protein